MTKRHEPLWDPTPPDSTLMDRQEWLNMGGDWVMDDAEIESDKGQATLHPPGTKLLKMDVGRRDVALDDPNESE